MLSKLLLPQVVEFIKEQEKSTLKPTDFDRLLFNKSKYPHIPMELVVDQLRARQKAKIKLPQWFNTEGVIFPPLLSMEQCSSELAAKYKSSLVQGGLAIDLTGGAGVDTYYLSKKFQRVIYVDFNKDLAEIAAHNFKILGVENIEVFNGKSEDFISQFSNKVDLIYIDPARRDQHKKLFLLEDCSPNILSLQVVLLQKATKVIVKASPMLDIAKGIVQLQNVSEVQVVGIKNEVKELLFIQEQKVFEHIAITSIDLGLHYKFTANYISNVEVPLSSISSFLYEPNATILKSGKSDELATKFNLSKLNRNTNLYTSLQLNKKFLGRKFLVEKVLKYDKREVRLHLASNQANIAIRNFPDTAEVVRKRLGLKQGGTTYLFGVRDNKNFPKIVICSKI